MGYLGVMYLSGVGVKQDSKEAMRWFLRAKTFGFDVTRQVAPVMEQWNCTMQTRQGFFLDQHQVRDGQHQVRRWR